MIDTKRAPRRKIEYDSIDELVADAERLVAADAPTTGNWSKGQIMEHIAKVIDMSIDGFPFSASWPVRFFSKHFFKNRFLRNGMPSGFKPSKSVATHIMPDETDVHAALDHLRSAAERLKSLNHNTMHVFFGELTPDETRGINRRHAEMHMSFIAEPVAVGNS